MTKNCLGTGEGMDLSRIAMEAGLVTAMADDMAIAKAEAVVATKASKPERLHQTQ